MKDPDSALWAFIESQFSRWRQILAALAPTMPPRTVHTSLGGSLRWCWLTEMNQPLLETPDKVAALIGRAALSRWGDWLEIREATVFLASAASSYVTGTSLYVDRGWTAG